MRLTRNLSDYPAGRPLISDELLEFHAARLLLLVRVCGRGSRIHGLTKLAKLDFFVRYPAFFAAIDGRSQHAQQEAGSAVESAMIRHHYGPWDPRYYHVLSFLEGCGLLDVTKQTRSFVFRLTPDGKGIADRLAKQDEFGTLVGHMRRVGLALSRYRGSQLRDLIYRAFRAEVADQPRGAMISADRAEIGEAGYRLRLPGDGDERGGGGRRGR